MSAYNPDPKQLVRPAVADPDNSVDLFDSTRANPAGTAFCVAAAIMRSDVQRYWQEYLRTYPQDYMTGKPERIRAPRR